MQLTDVLIFGFNLGCVGHSIAVSNSLSRRVLFFWAYSIFLSLVEDSFLTQDSPLLMVACCSTPSLLTEKADEGVEAPLKA